MAAPTSADDRYEFMEKEEGKEEGKVVVFGATGSCGCVFVAACVEAYIPCRVVTRSSSSVEKFSWAGDVEVAEVHTLDDQEAVNKACKGVRAVICFIGPRKTDKVSPLPHAVEAIAQGMRTTGVKRLLVQMGGFTQLKGESNGMGSKLAKGAFGMLMNEKVNLKGNDEAALILQEKCTDLDWTICRPGMLTEDAHKGVLEAGFDYGPGNPATACKIDLAHWYLSLVDDSKAIHKAPAPVYAKEDFHFARTPYKGAKKVAIITGGNSGLGYESARRLLLEGMQVVLACRNEERGKAAVEKLLGSTTNRPAPSDEDCVYMGLNLSDLKSVEAFSQNFIASKRPLHVLMCNAGVMAPPEYQETTDGIEMQFQANFLSHFLLCNLLSPVLIASKPSRIIHVSSIAARFCTTKIVPAEDGSIKVPKSPEEYDPMASYQLSKLLQVLHSRELNARLQNLGVTSNSLEPGIVGGTGLTKNMMEGSIKDSIKKGISVEEGAKTQVFLAASDRVSGKGGGNYVECRDHSKGVGKLKYLASARNLGKEMGPLIWKAAETMLLQRATVAHEM